MNLLTVKETARKLKLSLSMVYRLIANGELPSYAIGGCIRVDESELQKFLEQNRKETVKLPNQQRRHF
jgi:excisionase family DNA binding protein